MVRPGDLPPDAVAGEPLSSYLQPAQRLRVLSGGIAAARAADSIAFGSEFAVLVHRRIPFVMQATSPLLTTGDVGQLLSSTELSAFAAIARLPGPLEPIPTPPELRCRCPLGHRVTVPPGISACPRDGLPLKC